MFSSEVKIITVGSKDSCNHLLNHHQHLNHYDSRDLVLGTSLKQNYKIYQQQQQQQTQQSSQYHHHHHQQTNQQKNQQNQSRRTEITSKNQKNQKNNRNSNSNNNNNNKNNNNNNNSNSNNNHSATNNHYHKKVNNNSYLHLNNRKKHQLNNNNNNKGIKNQNIPSNEHAHNKKTSSTIKSINSSRSNSSNRSSSRSSNSSSSIDHLNITNDINKTRNKNNNNNNNNNTEIRDSKVHPSLQRMVTLHETPVNSCMVMNNNNNNNNNNTITSTITSATVTNGTNNNTKNSVLLQHPTETSITAISAANALTSATKTASTSTISATTLKNNSTTIQQQQQQSQQQQQPPASYSLDFLHSVGHQMTAGSSRFYTPAQLSSFRRAASAALIDVNYRQKFSQDLINGNKVGNGNGQNVQNQPRPTFKEYNYDMPPNVHPLRPYCHFIYQPAQAYHHHHPHHPHNNINHQYSPNAHHAAMQYVSGCTQIFSNSNSRNIHPKKLWHWIPNNMKNRCNGTNNINKFNSVSTNNLNHNTNSQTLPRTRYRNNHHNEGKGSGIDSVTTTPTTNEERKENGSREHFIGNSRSPTPSPKSESPLLYKSQEQEHSDLQNYENGVPASSNSSIISDNGVWNHSSGAIMSENGNDSIKATASISSSPTIETQGNVSLNGYESDSSQSSYRYNDVEFRVVKNSASTTESNYYNYQHQIPPDMTSLINFPTYSSDDNALRAQAHYYGSHQNLTFWNSGISTTSYSGGAPSHAIYTTSIASTPTTTNGGTSVSSDTSNSNHQYLGDGTGTTSKRSQSQNRTYRGRRQIYQGYRAHSFHDALYTPPDRFLAKSHLVEMKIPPSTLLIGSKWDQLSQDIWNKFLMAQQREETFRKKMYLWRYLYLTIKESYPRFGLYLVGSTISGFGADTSDVDMCLVSRTTSNLDPRMEAVLNLNYIKDFLSQKNVFEQFNLIEAKVPILRFKDPVHMFEVDLNFNNCVGIRNTHLLHCYSQLDWRLRPLVLVTKLWAQFHNINNAKNMTISSYSLALMVIHFLQYAVSPPVLPCLHTMYPEKFQMILKSNDFGFVDMNEEITPYISQNTQTLGELFLQFLEYYSNFDYSLYAISVRTGNVLPIEICRQAKSYKNDIHQWKELCIEEPFDLTNTARSVYDCETFERVKAVFITSWKILQETLDINSIFTPFLIPITTTMMMTTLPYTPSYSTAITTTATSTIPISQSSGKLNLLSPTLSSSSSLLIDESGEEQENHNHHHSSNNNNNNNNNQVPLKITPSIS